MPGRFTRLFINALERGRNLRRGRAVAAWQRGGRQRNSPGSNVTLGRLNENEPAEDLSASDLICRRRSVPERSPICRRCAEPEAEGKTG